LSSADPNAQFVSEETSRSKNKWAMTPDAFEKLLNSFSPDREQAGAQYEVIRRKLVRFFEWRAVGLADEYADETINRVARRIAEGQIVDNLKGYFYGVARMVCKEALKERERDAVALEEAPTNLRLEPIVDLDPDTRSLCLDRCLASLPVTNQMLIIEYYQEERRAKIELRQQLANKLEIPLNALRIRAHRIRVGLEKCITQCMSAPAVK
jgi:DNA-directed RNA polymerase specialized sigma24 family protein